MMNTAMMKQENSGGPTMDGHASMDGHLLPANGSKSSYSKRDSTTPKDENKDNEGSGKEESKKTNKRRKVNHACLYCRRSHMTCDQARPCSRCIKRDIGHLCHDEPREPKRMKSDPECEEGDESTSPLQQRPLSGQMGMPGQIQDNGQAHAGLNTNHDPMLQQATVDGNMLAPQDTKMNNHQPSYGGNQLYNDWNAQAQLDFGDFQSFPYDNMFNTPEVTNEYNLLNDFLNNSLLDDGGLYTGDDPSSMFTDPSFSNTLGPLTTNASFLNNQTNQLTPVSQAADGHDLKRPQSTARIDDKAQEKYYMTAADPAGTEPPEERMNKLLKAKYDAGLLKPFNYVKGYARLNDYMEKHMLPASRQKILRQLEGFRPMFRERMQTLTDIELIRVEMWFEMKLMEYDRVFASMAIPACCWRRTGEIFRGNREMAELINVPVERLREGKLAIHDIIGEESLVMYWSKFGQIAFDASKKAMLASCKLKRQDNDLPDGGMQCCFSFTIHRDEHMIPSIIIGNFLPVAT